MQIDQVRRLPPLERLLYFIKERESIRLKKEAGIPRPWTDDPILATYRFCNVRRMDDRVSQWLIRNWYMPGRIIDSRKVLVAAAMARFINLPESLQTIYKYVWEWKPEKIKQTLHNLQQTGLKVFNGAYIVSTNGRAMDKVDHVVDCCVAPLAEQPWDKWIDVDSMQRSCMRLQQCYGLAGFMSGQIVADLRWVLPGKWTDKNDWAPMGPGSRRGMNRLHSRPVDAPLSQRKFEQELVQLMQNCKRLLPKAITSRLEAIDAQNCLCEYDKMERCLDGGRAKQTYTPREEVQCQ